jgi:hypothetical protein
MVPSFVNLAVWVTGVALPLKPWIVAMAIIFGVTGCVEALLVFRRPLPLRMKLLATIVMVPLLFGLAAASARYNAQLSESAAATSGEKPTCCGAAP